MKTLKRLSEPEFIAMVAMLTATVAFSIDAMLSALPDIAAALSPAAPNRAQLIVTSFIFGLGIGTLFTGPLSDAYGRKPIVVAGTGIYLIGSAMAWAAPSLELLIAARIFQGLGAAGARVVALALVRDLYSGRDMARIMSFVMLVFSLVPAIAPTIGHFIILGFGWRSIFAAFMAFAAISLLWFSQRQAETLLAAQRRPVHLKGITLAIQEMLQHRVARLALLVQIFISGILFVVLACTQQVFDITYGQGGYFHYWFGGIAVVSTSASLLNARLVVRIGMRSIIKTILIAHVIGTICFLGIQLSTPPYWIGLSSYVGWLVLNFCLAGLTIGNLNALAMEDLGHIAGLVASVLSCLSAVGGVIIAVPIAGAFDGTAIPMGLGILGCTIVALWLTTILSRTAPKE